MNVGTNSSGLDGAPKPTIRKERGMDGAPTAEGQENSMNRRGLRGNLVSRSEWLVEWE